MKLKKAIILFSFFCISLTMFSRNSMTEMSVGLLHLKLAYYTPIGANSYIGGNASAGLIAVMVPLAEIAPTYKYYFTPEKNATFFISSEIYLQGTVIPTPAGKVNTYAIGAGAGIGYKVYLGKKNKFFFRPTLNLRVPVYRSKSIYPYGDDLSEAILYKTVMNTLSIGYRF